MNEQYKILANKLKALAERGVGGEKSNAKAALNRLLKKHGISYDDLESEKIGDYWINTQGYCKLFTQVAVSVLGAKTDVWHNKKHGNRKRMIKTTLVKSIEVEAKFNFYKKLYLEELETFYSAFLISNHIFPLDGDIVDPKSLSKDERDKANRAIAMASNVKSESFHKLLSGSSTHPNK